MTVGSYHKGVYTGDIMHNIATLQWIVISPGTEQEELS